MAVLEIKIVEERETLSILKPGTLVPLSEGRPLRGALVTDSDTAYYVQGGRFGLVFSVVGPNIDSCPQFGGRLRWRKNTPDEPFETSRVDPTRLAFLPR